jgi:DNA end-binding protein Ku
MASARKRVRSQPKKPSARSLPYHAFWSGSLTFGLVNVPVLVYPATRHPGVMLRMMSPDGSLLERRFVCPRDGEEVSSTEIVRGYELDDGSYIVVEDDELEAIEPRKTREIDLRQFVDLADLPLPLLERGYFMTPLQEATKAYRLLAEAMEQTQRAGIATFVMREREYVVAIFARHGILCAETLRFQNEIRDPKTIGLPEHTPVARKRVALFERSICALSSKEVPRAELVDRATEALLAIIEKKRKSGRDLIRTDHDASRRDFDQDGDIDLLETIRRSLRHSANGSVGRRPHGRPWSHRSQR